MRNLGGVRIFGGARISQAMVGAGAATLLVGCSQGGETLTGTLGGDAELEGGCAWLDDDGTRHTVEWPEGYTVDFDPVRLLDAEGEQIAAEGDEFSVKGSESDDATTCMVGALFVATDVLD